MYGDNAIISIMNQVSFFVRSMIWKRKAIFTSLLGIVEPKWFFLIKSPLKRHLNSLILDSLHYNNLSNLS